MRDRLRRIDLNLLIVFSTLMNEPSVLKTAERLCVSQPAMSKSLQRLRDQLEDELFTRSPNGLVPTRFAAELYPSIAKSLESIEQALFDVQFDPSSIEDECRIAILESASSWFIPSLVASIRERVPVMKPGRYSWVTKTADHNALFCS